MCIGVIYRILMVWLISQEALNQREKSIFPFEKIERISDLIAPIWNCFTIETHKDAPMATAADTKIILSNLVTELNSTTKIALVQVSYVKEETKSARWHNSMCFMPHFCTKALKLLPKRFAQLLVQ